MLVLVESHHIEAVSSHVMGGTGECHEPEEAYAPLQPEVGLDSECHSREGCSQEQLHGHYPPPLGLEQIKERTPEWLYHPWEIEPRGIERYLGIAQAHLHVYLYAQQCYRHIGQTLGKIKRGNPAPWRQLVSGLFRRLFMLSRKGGLAVVIAVYWFS